MSFDIFFQRFEGGPDSRPGAVEALLAPRVVERSDGFIRIGTSDGEADVYASNADDNLMINHLSGRVVWDLMYEIAVAGRFAVFPGDAICVPDDDVRRSLPAEMQSSATVVRSGADLLAVVESS